MKVYVCFKYSSFLSLAFGQVGHMDNGILPNLLQKCKAPSICHHPNSTDKVIVKIR